MGKKFCQSSYNRIDMNIPKQVIDKAIKTAKASNVIRGKVGATIFTNSGHIITSAHNAVMLGKIEEEIFTIHAEEHATLKALKMKAVERFGKLNILIVRWKPSSDILANAKPCRKCQYYLKKAGFRVFYTNEFGNIERL